MQLHWWLSSDAWLHQHGRDTVLPQLLHSVASSYLLVYGAFEGRGASGAVEGARWDSGGRGVG